jgi:hypothetical protein
MMQIEHRTSGQVEEIIDGYIPSMIHRDSRVALQSRVMITRFLIQVWSISVLSSAAITMQNSHDWALQVCVGPQLPTWVS